MITTGGKYGYEIIDRFLSVAPRYLTEQGVILIVFSSLTKQNKVDEIISNYALVFELLEKIHVSFEDLFCYKITKSELLKQVEKIGVTNVKRLTRGHRGIIYTGFLNKKTVAIKSQIVSPQIIHRIKNEVVFLEKLNKDDIGPKLIFAKDDFFVCEYIDGQLFEDFIKNQSHNDIKIIIREIFDQMYTLDKLGVSKEEMTNPYKHILIKNKKPILIDFERCSYTEKPKNVTQFCQYITHLKRELTKKGFDINPEHMIKLCKLYKLDRSIKHFKQIVALYLD